MGHVPECVASPDDANGGFASGRGLVERDAGRMRCAKEARDGATQHVSTVAECSGGRGAQEENETTTNIPAQRHSTKLPIIP